MPWDAQTFASRHNKALTGDAASSAAKQANAMLRAGMPEGEAIATANKEAARRARPQGWRGRKTRSYIGA